MLFISLLLSCALRICLCEFHPKLSPVTTAVIHGEGPHWDEDRQALFYVDITNQTLNKYEPNTGKSYQVYIEGGAVTPVIPVKFEEKYIIGRGLDLAVVTWDGKSSKPTEIKVLTSVDNEKPLNRFNDGKVDNGGRLWAGTMGPENPDLVPEQGSLYSFEPFNNFKPVKQLSPVSVSNGLAWNRNDTIMYYIDSPTRKIDIFDFDLVNGKIGNRRTLFDLEENKIRGFPDGMTIDENENLWVALYNGNAVINVDSSSGKLLNKIEFPVTKVTSCAFGGDQLDKLYVTTSRRGLNEEELKKEPFAGAVFEVTDLRVRGQTKSNKLRIFSSEASN